MSELPVVAVVANYNMAAELKNLLPQLLKQGYKEIFVLDDASTDNSLEVVKRYSDKIKLVAGKMNKGSGGNRNRIIGRLDYDAIIHFLDADIDLETEHCAAVIQELMPTEEVAFIGGLIKTKEGRQHEWNFGPRNNLHALIGSLLQLRLATLARANRQKAARFRRRYRWFLKDWPDLLSAPVPGEIFWNAEANLAIRSDTFARFEGFDERLRETDILDLAVRMHRAGLKAYFNPRLAVRHTEGQVRTYNRTLRKARESFQLAWRHGILNWLFRKNS